MTAKQSYEAPTLEQNQQLKSITEDALPISGVILTG